MKKAFKLMAMAAVALSMTTLLSCDGDDTEEPNGGTPEPEAVAVPLEQAFESMPSDWTTIDADGDGYNWYIGMGENSGQGPFTSGVGGSNCIASASWDNDVVLTPDNYLVSPEFHVHSTGGYTLTWYDAAQDAEWPAEHYSVYAGTLENGVFSPMGELFSITLSSTDFTKRSVSLDAYNGKDIRIAFRHHNCSDVFVMKIDDVKVSKDGAKGPATIACKEGVKKVK